MKNFHSSQPERFLASYSGSLLLSVEYLLSPGVLPVPAASLCCQRSPLLSGTGHQVTTGQCTTPQQLYSVHMQPHSVDSVCTDDGSEEEPGPAWSREAAGLTTV